MTIITTRAQRRELARQNAKLPEELRPVPRQDWPNPNGAQRNVWRSRHYLVQEFEAPAPAFARLSINRTVLDGARWADGLSWDELQAIKAQCGHGHLDAVEVFPSSADVINVANMRHLWLMRDPLPFAWRRHTGSVTLDLKDAAE